MNILYSPIVWVKLQKKGSYITHNATQQHFLLQWPRRPDSTPTFVM